MELLQYPNPTLFRKCADVAVGDLASIELAHEMAAKLYEWNGIGLAAPQVGILKKIAVIDLREEPRVLYVLINPRITWRSVEVEESNEGCLSLPLLRETIFRHKTITLEYLDENFSPKVIQRAEGLLSFCIQHEIDHLNGHLFIDHMSKLARARVVQKFKKLREESVLPNTKAVSHENGAQ
ncbi:MAG: peptide deformylase [Holosporaceae bacterium]|jgi:peptide deformylase|nr:peptide deformylase [Holosporaceae bacterium]